MPCPFASASRSGAGPHKILDSHDRIALTLPRIGRLALGGTAVGTGINAHPEFAKKVAEALSRKLSASFVEAPDHFEAQSGQDSSVELSGQLKGLALCLLKISNDLRWMNSGPNAGLGEITLPPLQPGSSIMPGKINPVVPEAVMMVAAQVVGNDATITIAASHGNFELMAMLPVIADNLLESLKILANACRLLADKAIAGFTVNRERIAAAVARNPVLVTALTPRIGYELAAAIAHQASAQGRPVKDVAAEQTGLSDAELNTLLDPRGLTLGGIKTA